MSEDLNLKITLDSGEVVQGFLNIEKASKKTADKAGGSFDSLATSIEKSIDDIAPSISNAGKNIISALATPMGLVTAAIGVAGVAIKKSFDLTIEGEKLKKIDAQFTALAETFSVAGESLKEKFVGSLGGLVDDSDAVQALNKAFITLGDKVTQLPEVMGIARKATNLFGGDIVQNFEAINQAIATGATRQLRGLGIIIDSDKAYEKYAKSIGVTKDVLSEAGKQQAILNEVLAKGEQRFKNVSAESGGLTSAYTRFKISLNNAAEDVAKSFASSGGYLEKFFNSLDLIVKKISGDPQQKLEDLQIKINETKNTLFDLQTALEKRQSAKGFDSFLQPFKDGEGVTSTVLLNIANTKKQLDVLNSQYAELNKKNVEAASNKSLKTDGTTDNNANSIDQKLQFEATKKREKELTDFLLNQEQSRTNAKIQLNQLALSEVITNEEKLRLTTENLDLADKLREEQKNQQITAIKEKYRQDNLTGSVYEKQSLLAIENNFNQQSLAAEAKRQSDLKLLRQQADFDQLSGFASVGAGFNLMMQGMAETAITESATIADRFKKLGSEIFSSVGTRVGAAFQAFGSALRKGEDAGQAFVNVMGQQIAQIASQIGNFFIQAGIARVAASYGADATGYVMIAAGAALNIIGGMLSASIGGGGGSTAGASSESGGGIASNPSASTELTQQPDLAQKEQSSQVQVVIQGSVYDSDETGSRIVDLINTAFDKKGVVVNQGVFA